MELDGRIIRQMILFTLAVLIVPMILFPMLLGTSLMQSSLIDISFASMLFELVIYGFCIYFFNKETDLVKLILNATICLVGRYIIGGALGLLIAMMYAMNVGVALSFSTSNFWPAVVLHVLATPFILKPLFVVKQESRRTKPPQQAFTETVTARKSMVQDATTQSKPESYKAETTQMQADYSSFQSHKSIPAKPQTGDGFQNAVNYIGENGSVLMVAIVDNEGLLLSGYQRAMFNAEDVAPLVLPIIESNKLSLHKMQLAVPEKTEMMFENQRLVFASEKYYTLVVISERTLDDVLNIRINQALEMIRIYTAERYSEKLIGNAETIYV